MRNGPTLFVFLLPVCICIARLHSLAGEGGGAGGPNSYDSTESLVLYILYSLYASPRRGIRLIEDNAKSLCFKSDLERHFAAAALFEAPSPPGFLS